MSHDLVSPIRLVVLISGNGSNLQAIIDNITDKGLPAQIVAVISNKADAYGLERAKKAEIEQRVLSHKDFSDHRWLST
jgi:phosphoribosylglycinamide formyltransferase-1